MVYDIKIYEEEDVAYGMLKTVREHETIRGLSLPQVETIEKVLKRHNIRYAVKRINLNFYLKEEK